MTGNYCRVDLDGSIKPLAKGETPTMLNASPMIIRDMLDKYFGFGETTRLHQDKKKWMPVSQRAFAIKIKKVQVVCSQITTFWQ